ncbi:NAD(P)-dependent oxidoreductase [Streptomyces orinoci]|uniref:NAD(P)-binding domain-containing protein n=1 Tax=Streptomyces orinoci TaxID=67339 RepID=A0ABV3JZ68_STRON|nr:NAD(P)-binding domain-containing protein [Streptomyces orinoci]
MGKQAVTVIGLGPMGQAMAAAFLSGGHPVTVWNRTASKAEALAAQGAVVASSAEEALAAQELVVLSLTDYDAMYAILEPAAPALAGRVLVNLSSDTPERARAAAAWAAGHGAEHLTGGVQVPPALIGKPGAATYYSGPREVFDAHRETLEVLTEADFRGTDPGLAAMYYQALMTTFWTGMLGCLQTLALARAHGVTATEMLPQVSKAMTLLPGILGSYASHIDAGRHPGDDARLSMGAASMQHVLHTNRDAGLDTTLLSAVDEIFRRGMARGLAENSFSSLVEVLNNPAE